MLSLTFGEQHNCMASAFWIISRIYSEMRDSRKTKISSVSLNTLPTQIMCFEVGGLEGKVHLTVATLFETTLELVKTSTCSFRHSARYIGG